MTYVYAVTFIDRLCFRQVSVGRRFIFLSAIKHDMRGGSLNLWIK